jgi:uncharacterized protein
MTAPKFEPVPPAAGPIIRGFAGRGFLIDRTTYRAALLTPKKAIAWQPPDLAVLAPDDVAAALALDPPPEFLVLGTGAAHGFPPPAFVAALEARGIGVEPMDSRAAARCWGLLRGEGRWIAAALMPL